MEFTLTYTLAPKALKEKIAMVKHIRELTGWGLKEAKDLVDNLEREGTTKLNIAADELPANFLTTLAKEKINWLAKAQNAPEEQNNIIVLRKFEGDILQEIDLKSFLHTQFRLNYLEAAEVIAQLKKGESKQLDINPAEKIFICAALERYNVTFDFGLPSGDSIKEFKNIEKLVEQFQNIDINISLRISNNPNIIAPKLQLVKVLRQYSIENWDLATAKEKAEEILEKGHTYITIHCTQFVAFVSEIKELKLYLETHTL